MFIIWGFGTRRKVYNSNKLSICSFCGQYGHFNMIMTYSTLTIFFIPTFRWNKRYYIQTSCCGRTYEIDKEIGKAIVKGTFTGVLPGELVPGQEPVQPAQPVMQPVQMQPQASNKKCPQCNEDVAETSKFCPNCGAKFE